MKKESAKKFTSVPSLSLSRAFKEMGRNAYVDWIVIIFLTFAVIVVLLAGSTYLYFAVTRGDIRDAPVSSDEDSTEFDDKALLNVMTTFNQKSAVTDQAKRAFTGIADPSQ